MPDDVIEDKKDRRETRGYWTKWIQAAKKTAKHVMSAVRFSTL